MATSIPSIGIYDSLQKSKLLTGTNAANLTGALFVVESFVIFN